ncbi:PH domain-containing protein [Virgibacillus sp. LDC-1]|nr:PH domain-containing protein [Virgibacillus sp. LDC-1]
MRLPPRNSIARDAVKVWKIMETIYVGFFWLFIIAGGISVFWFDFPRWPLVVAVIVGVIMSYFVIFQIPELRWRRWRYEVFEQEVYIQHGILIQTRTLVPMIRVQHVDTKQGPILKKYQLASVTISTAATTHEIPALTEEDAAALRDRISNLARVDDDDV